MSAMPLPITPAVFTVFTSASARASKRFPLPGVIITLDRRRRFRDPTPRVFLSVPAPAPPMQLTSPGDPPPSLSNAALPGFEPSGKFFPIVSQLRSWVGHKGIRLAREQPHQLWVNEKL